MNPLIEASKYHGYSVSFFHQMRLNKTEQFEYINTLGKGNIKEGYTKYKDCILIEVNSITDYIYSQEDEGEEFLKYLKENIHKTPENVIFKRLDHIRFKEYKILKKINTHKDIFEKRK